MTLKRVSERLLQGGSSAMTGYMPPASIRTKVRSSLNLGDLCEPTPDPDDPSLTPGESFAARIDPDVTALKTQGMSEDEKRAAVIRLVTQKLDEAGFDPDSGVRRYVRTLYTQAYRLFYKAKTRADLLENGNIVKKLAMASEISAEVEVAYEELKRRIGVSIWVPNLNSAANVEAELMALSYCNECTPGVSLEDALKGDEPREMQPVQRAFCDYFAASNWIDPLPSNYRHRFNVWTDRERLMIPDAGFGGLWLLSNFAKVEIGHKLAAALCLTDVPDDIELKAPWDGWSLVIPPGLLSFDRIVDEHGDLVRIEVVRALCVGTKPRYLLGARGEISPVKDPVEGNPKSREMQAIRNLVKGVCLAMSEPDDFRRESVTKSTKSKRSGGAPDLNQARFMLSAPIVIDLRDHLKAVLRGEHKTRDGGRLTVQFLVHGHWKNQAHGPHHSLRKRIWIQPFWKGDEQARVLLRNYKVKDDEAASDPGVKPSR